MSELIVETQAGKVRGKKGNSCDATEFYAFKGIPYAQPPIGELRFKVSALSYNILNLRSILTNNLGNTWKIYRKR